MEVGGVFAMFDGSTSNNLPMNFHFFWLPLAVLLFSTQVFSQSLTVTLVGGADTTGMTTTEQLALERSVELQLPFGSGGSDTLVVELGPSVGSYDLMQRRFSLGETGTFDDGCSLETGGSGLVVGLGSFTGIESFYVRAYLASAGEGSAITLSN